MATPDERGTLATMTASATFWIRRRVSSLALVVQVAALLCAITRIASAHPIEFGALRIESARNGDARIVFRFSGTELRPADARVVLPASCRDLHPARQDHDAIGSFESRTVHCPRGIEDGAIRIVGLTGGCQVLVTFVHPDGREERSMVDASHASFRIASGRHGSVTSRYLTLGLEHIATGADHLAFVAALMLLVRTRKQLLAAITAFTAGHSITLALAALGFVHVASAPVETLIALSILLVANEVAHPDHDTLTRRQPWIVAALFGLVHGLGFAGALASVGLPRGEIPLALAMFNVGVEFGQIAFVLIAASTAWIVLRIPRTRPDPLRRVGVYGLGAFGSYLFFDRFASMLH